MKTGTLHTSYNEGGLSMLGWHYTSVHEIPGQGFQCAVMRDQRMAVILQLRPANPRVLPKYRGFGWRNHGRTAKGWTNP